MPTTLRIGKLVIKLPFGGGDKAEGRQASVSEHADSLAETVRKERFLEFSPDYRILETYSIEDPWARVYIVEDRNKGSVKYIVDEIPLTKEEREVYEKIKNILYWELEPPEPGEDPKKHFEEQAKKIVGKFRIRFTSTIHPAISWNKIEYYIIRDTVGYGDIDAIMKDKYIEDISCDGVGKPIYVWHSKYESIPTNIEFKDESSLDSLILKLAHKAGKHVSVAYPIVDAILPEGHRLAATYKREVSTHGSTFTIRKFKDKPLSIIDLLRGRTLSYEIAAYFWLAMEYNMTGMIMGVTGAGKTTMLNALATLLRPTVKVVTIEDTPELKLTLENWVQLVARPSYGFEKGTSEITLYDLVRVSLRYRPDVLIVGEVRGEEAKVLFQAIATGHGGISTIHAENVEAMVKRLTSPPMDIPEGYINLVNFALAVRRHRLHNPDGTYKIIRVVTDVWEIRDYNDYQLVARWNAATRKHEIDLNDSLVLEKISMISGETYDNLLEEIARRSLVLKWMAYKGITDYIQVGNIIGKYYRKPNEVYREAEEEVRRIEEFS